MLPHNSRSEAVHKVSYHLPDLHPPRDLPEYDPHAVAVAFLAREVPKLIELNNPDVPTENKRQALKLLCDKCVSQEKKCEALTDDAVPVMITLMRDADAVVRQHAAKVLGCLSKVVQGRASVRDSGGLEALLHAFHDKEADVRLEVAQCLMHFSTALNDGCSALVSAGTVYGIVEGMDDASPPVSKSCIQALSNVARLDEGIEHALLAGVMPRLCRLLLAHRDGLQAAQAKRGKVKPTNIPDAIEFTVTILQAIQNVSNHPEGKVSALQSGIVPAIAPLLDVVDEDSIEVLEWVKTIRRLTTGIVMSLAVDEQGKVACINACSTSMARLLSTRRAGEEGMMRNVIQSVNLMREHPLADELGVFSSAMAIYQSSGGQVQKRGDNTVLKLPASNPSWYKPYNSSQPSGAGAEMMSGAFKGMGGFRKTQDAGWAVVDDSTKRI